MIYVLGAMERVMKVQEVILRALSGQLTWPQAADILGRSPRSIRRLRWCYERYGYDGLFDRRRRIPSPRRAPVAEVERAAPLPGALPGLQRPALPPPRAPRARRDVLLLLREEGPA